jgi:hypothetical protein
MLLNELRGKPVTCDGEKLGLVIDLRLVIDGTPSLLQSQARLLGVVIGRKPHAAFMGYERASVNAPALLAHYFRWRERGAFLVAAEDIEHVGTDGVRVRSGFTRWSAMLAR